MKLNEKLATIQTKFKSKKVDITPSVSIISDQRKIYLEATKPYLLELGVSVTINEEIISFDPFPIMNSQATIS